MVEQEQMCENGTPTITVDKKDLSEQRKKAGKLTLSDLCDHFHLPIEEASEKVDFCPTVLKKTCRKAGLTRWPHRKVYLVFDIVINVSESMWCLVSVSLYVSCDKRFFLLK